MIDSIKENWRTITLGLVLVALAAYVITDAWPLIYMILR